MLIGTLVAARAESAEDVASLEKQLSDEVAALSTSNCSLACRALESIRRAAERICALEPGPRCDAARAKAADATRRVHDACPDCATVDGATKHEELKREPAPAAPAAAPSTAEVATRSESRGGCRSCTLSGPSDFGSAWWLLAAWGAWRVRRAPKKSRRRA
jgi:hypothetical protein